MALNFNEFYHDLLKQVWYKYEYLQEFNKDERDESINRKTYREVYNVNKSIFNLQEDVENMENGKFKFICYDESRAKKMVDYMEDERKMFDNMDIFNHHKISKFWNHIKNPDGSSNANYGFMAYGLKDARISWDERSEKISQFDYCYNILKDRISSKQAVMNFHRPKDQWLGNLDVPCNLQLHFYVKNGKKFCMNAYMRSNDLIYGTPYNFAYFLLIYSRLFNKLREVHRDLEYGEYHHVASSMRIYEHHGKKVFDIIGPQSFLV